VGGTCGTRGGGRRCLQGFGWRPEGKRPLGRPRCRWEDNIKLDLRDFFGSGYGSVTGFFEHGNERSGSIKKAGYCLTS
jgi:hypothetical protein